MFSSKPAISKQFFPQKRHLFDYWWHTHPAIVLSLNIMTRWVALVCDLHNFGSVLWFAVVIPIVLEVDVNVNGRLFVSFFMFKKQVSGQVFLQQLPVTRALQRFFSHFKKLSFGGCQSNVSMTMVVFISCHFHGDVRWSLDQVYSLSYYDKVICNFAKMEGYYVEKTWSVFESHSTNTFCEWHVVKAVAFRFYENKTRAVSNPSRRKSKKRKISSSWTGWPLKWVALCGDWLFISLGWMQIIFAAEVLVIRLAKRS